MAWNISQIPMLRPVQRFLAKQAEVSLILGIIFVIAVGSAVLLFVLSNVLESESQNQLKILQGLEERKIVKALEARVELAVKAVGLIQQSFEDQEQAKRLAAKVVDSFRYGNGNYIWVSAVDPNSPEEVDFVVHPADRVRGKRPNTLIDLDLVDSLYFQGELFLKDNPVVSHINPTDVFKVTTSVCFGPQSEEGKRLIAHYYWPKVRDGKITREGYPKIAYLACFPKWRWIIGTGEWADSIDRIVAASARDLSKWREDVIHQVFVTIVVYSVVLVGIVALYLYSVFLFRKRVDRQLRLAQRLESVGQLAAGIAHEINSPAQYVGDNVTFLKSAAGDLLKATASYKDIASTLDNQDLKDKFAQVEEDCELDYWEEEIPDAIAAASEGMSRIKRIVGAMKDFSHPGTAERQKVDLNKCIESALAVSRHEWRYVAQIETDLDSEMPMLIGYTHDLNQMLLNLIVNAAHTLGEKEKEQAGFEGKIRIKTSHTQDVVRIEVQDNGKGMSEEVKDRAFDTFYTTKPVGEGTGQGLAIVYAVVVDKHKGMVELHSEEGKGSTFVIELPLSS